MARIYTGVVDGAPFCIRAQVKVITLTDHAAATHLLGKVGRVEYLDYDCGCGQTFPGDPMIGVRFYSGELEEFWKEELAPYFIGVVAHD